MCVLFDAFMLHLFQITTSLSSYLSFLTSWIVKNIIFGFTILGDLCYYNKVFLCHYVHVHTTYHVLHSTPAFTMNVLRDIVDEMFTLDGDIHENVLKIGGAVLLCVKGY
jgi:hypothetical protein